MLYFTVQVIYFASVTVSHQVLSNLDVFKRCKSLTIIHNYSSALLLTASSALLATSQAQAFIANEVQEEALHMRACDDDLPLSCLNQERKQVKRLHKLKHSGVC